jgi:hypothetical protein
MPNRCNLTGEAQLAEQAQAVVGKGCQVKQHIVGVKLARGQPLKVRIGLEFRMELLMRAVVLVELDHLGHRYLKAGP